MLNANLLQRVWPREVSSLLKEQSPQRATIKLQMNREIHKKQGTRSFLVGSPVSIGLARLAGSWNRPQSFAEGEPGNEVPAEKGERHFPCVFLRVIE